MMFERQNWGKVPVLVEKEALPDERGEGIFSPRVFPSFTWDCNKNYLKIIVAGKQAVIKREGEERGLQESRL
jgi:hypothetical protein